MHSDANVALLKIRKRKRKKKKRRECRHAFAAAALPRLAFHLTFGFGFPQHVNAQCVLLLDSTRAIGAVRCGAVAIASRVPLPANCLPFFFLFLWLFLFFFPFFSLDRTDPFRCASTYVRCCTAQKRDRSVDGLPSSCHVLAEMVWSR